MPEPDRAWRRSVDAQIRLPVLAFTVSAVVWLLIGTLAADMAAFQFVLPDLLGGVSWLSFGRMRPFHLNTMIWGWLSMAGVAISLWLWGRMLKTEVRHPWALLLACALWNVGVLVGTVGILAGFSRGVEWLEMPLPAFAFLVPALGLVAFSMIATLPHRRVHHLYVSVWYLGAALLWTPFLIVAALLPIYTGVVSGTMNWWFAHNILGLWLTPLGLAAAYYFIPKVVGRPVYSYHLSYLGFWTLALFYNWAGVHHLVGGPVPQWVVTVSIVFSGMMAVPVLIVAVNHHMTAFSRIRRVVYSPTLRFIVFGAMSYTVVSLHGSAMAFRSFQELIHFTHHTVGHAHIGVYAFGTMIAFGSLYYILPRVTGWEWQSRRLISLHFWTTALGIGTYITAMVTGGLIQGYLMNLTTTPFAEVVEATRPWLWARGAAGLLMAVGHVAFAVLVWQIVRRKGTPSSGPLFLRQPPPEIYRRMTGAEPPQAAPPVAPSPLRA
ncbi:MAG: cbb3-type cytochrome c oxidase subunit I [Rubricoccaceae bacterium]